MEADILFHFASLDKPSGRLGLSDFAKVLDPSWRNTMYDHDESATAAAKESASNFLSSALESVYNFGLGSVAGAFGAFMV
jgi:solute carrier family 25 aspartate/glutamate transporter 12/13